MSDSDGVAKKETVAVGSIVCTRHDRVSLATHPKWLNYGEVKEIRTNSFGRTVYLVSPLEPDESFSKFSPVLLEVRDEENPDTKKRQQLLGHEIPAYEVDAEAVEMASESLTKRGRALQVLAQQTQNMLALARLVELQGLVGKPVIYTSKIDPYTSGLDKLGGSIPLRLGPTPQHMILHGVHLQNEHELVLRMLHPEHGRLVVYLSYGSLNPIIMENNGTTIVAAEET